MRILVTSGIFPPDIGGPATYVPTMATALVDRGHHVTVVAASDWSNGPIDDSCYSFDIRRIPRKPVAHRFVHVLREALRQAESVDLIFANGLFVEATIAASISRRPLVAKFVGDEAWERSVRLRWTTDRFEDFQSGRQTWRAEALRAFRSGYARRATHVIVPSQYLADVVRGWGIPPQRCSVIYNAVIPTEAKDRQPSVQQPQVPLRVLTASRLLPWKGIDLLIDVLAALPDVVATVVGDGG